MGWMGTKDRSGHPVAPTQSLNERKKQHKGKKKR